MPRFIKRDRDPDDFYESMPMAVPYSEGVVGNPIARTVEIVVGALEVLLAFRLVFLLFGANAGNGFVNTIYDLTQSFVSPFYGILPQIQRAGIDGATLIAMVVYVAVGFLLSSMIRALSNRY